MFVVDQIVVGADGAPAAGLDPARQDRLAHHGDHRLREPDGPTCVLARPGHHGKWPDGQRE